MNAHIPQSVEAATELREIAAVSKQLISPRLAKPLISVVQDTLVGVNRLTRPSEFFTRREFMNLLVHSKRWDGRIPPPAKAEPTPMWSGLQVVSALLPAVYLEMGNKMWKEANGKSDPNYVIIQNGVIKQGILDGDIFDKALIHILYNDFGPETTVDFLDSLQAVVAAYLQNAGFSVGLSDLIADADTLSLISADLTTLKKQIESLQLQVHTGLFDNTSGRTNQEEFENKVFETLNKAISAAGRTGLTSLIAANRMVNMVRCGSKGSDLNIAQMIALLGQQAIEGKRIAYGFQDRTLPHFKRYDDGAEARGFIESSFVKGLSPAEFFFHAMTGREGLIDTAVKSVTGDTLINVRNTNGEWNEVMIGPWIDELLATSADAVEHSQPANLELLRIPEGTHIWTADEKGVTSIAPITAVTRHDPGTLLYKITTECGKQVTVSASKSLIAFDTTTSSWIEKAPSEVAMGDFVPVIVNESSSVTPAKIASIIPMPVLNSSEKLYDLTVPSTLNFALSNGLVVRDTADSGYMQRQLVKTMEDLMTYHDGTVRDAGGLIVQFAYGDDGTSATKVENQPIGLAKMTDTEIRDKFSVPDVAADKSQAYLDAIFRDRDMLVRNVWNGRVEGSVQSAVHLRRLIGDAIQQLALEPGKGAPVPGAHVLESIQRIHERTRADNALWGALLRFYLNPRELQARGFTRAAFDWLAEQIVVRHMKTWVAPGEMAGIIAAQSIGEPTTQLTLNSVDWDTGIIIARDGRIWTPQIGQFIDDYIADCEKTAPERIQRLANDQIYVSLEGDGHDWQALSPDEDGKMMWTKLEAITKHPVINADGSDTILEVELESGRKIKATKARSFLRRSMGVKLLQVNGSDLEIGDEIPVVNNFVIPSIGEVTHFNMREMLPPTEWLYGTEVTNALTAMTTADATGNRHWFSKANGNTFTVPYGRSDAFRDAFTKGKFKHSDEIHPGFVYPKKLWKTISQIPDTIPLDRLFGYFCGAYLAEGNSNETQVMITNNIDDYLAPIRGLMDAWHVGYHMVSVDKVSAKTGIKGHSQSLIIHSTLLAAMMQRVFGRVSYGKKIPDWVLQAPDDFVKGLVDGYISGDGCVTKKGTMISVLSVSEQLLQQFALLLSRYGIFSTIRSHMPDIGVFDEVHMHYTLTIPAHYARIFARTFDLILPYKQERLMTGLASAERTSHKWTTFNDVVIDKIVAIREIEPLGDRVYDVTVATTRNFTTKSGIASADTFHLSGVAAKSGMTRGVPRIKELFKVTQNPRATSLTIYLRPDIRQSKEEARKLAQELEFTMLKDLVTKSRIYYDPRDSATLIAEDKEWLSFFSLFEQEMDPDDSGAVTDDEDEASVVASKHSPWIVRLELDREKMFSKNITMEDVAYVLRQAAGDSVNMTYTDHNASRMIFRIRLARDEKDASMDDLTSVKAAQTKLLTQTLVRGLPGLRTVTFRKVPDELYERNPTNDGKYEPVEQFVLDTLGTNFLDVMIHPDVDGLRLISNHVHDIYENLGIEAARNILFREIYGLFAEAAPVNYRHIALLVDAMTNRGRLMSADRHGTQKKKIGPLAKASFEQAEDIMLKAALFGEMDPVTGVSANIMTGQPIRGGTSFTQILLDEAALAELVATAPPPRRMIERAPQLAQEQVTAILEAPEKAGCRQEDLRIPAALPPIDPTVPVATALPELDIIITDE